MKDEERVALSFERKHNHLNVTLTINPESETLNIKVENTQTREQFGQIVDEDYIHTHQIFDGIPVDPISVYDFITENFDKVIVNEFTINFTYVWGKSIKKTRTISIELVKQENDSAKVERLTKELTQRDKKIEQLEIILEQSTKKIRKLEKQMRRNILEMEKLIETHKQKEVEYEQNIQKLTKKLQNMEESKKQPLFKPFQSPKQEKELQSKIAHHLKDLYQYYRLSNTKRKGVKIMRQGTSQRWYNFVNGQEILPNQTAKYSIKVVKSANNDIMFGFCTKSGLGMINNCYNLDSAYYNCYGYFYQAGQMTSIQKSENGDVIEVEADLVGGVLRFKKNGNPLKQCGVPKKMAKQIVHLSIMMYSAGDKIEILNDD